MSDARNADHGPKEPGLIDNLERLAKIVLPFLQVRGRCVAFSLGLIGVGAAGLKLDYVDLVVALLKLVGVEAQSPSDDLLQKIVALSLIVIGLAGGTFCARQADKIKWNWATASIAISDVTPNHMPPDVQTFQMTLRFVIDVIGRDVVLVAFEGSRFVDGLEVTNFSDELVIDGEVQNRGSGYRQPLAIGAHRVEYVRRFAPPFRRVWSLWEIAEGGFVVVSATYRKKGSGKDRKRTFYLRHDVPRLGPDRLVTVARAPEPKWLNNKLLTVAVLRGWISHPEARRARQWKDWKRHRAIELGAGADDGISEADVTWLRTLNHKLLTRRTTFNGAVEAAGKKRFPGLASTWVTVLDRLGLIR